MCTESPNSYPASHVSNLDMICISFNKNILHCKKNEVFHEGFLELMWPCGFGYIKDSATDIWFFGIWCKSLVKVAMQNFRLLFLIETDL